MFPALVGMNRLRSSSPPYSADVPRTRGDEPTVETNLVLALECSPHSWG